MQQRDKTSKNKVCPICDMIFTKKFNRDLHILNLHKGETGNDSSLGNVANDEQNMLPSFVSDDNNLIAESFDENLNSSFLSDDGEIIDVNLSKLDHQTPIYAVSEMKSTPINSISQENISTNNHSGDNESNMNTIDVIAKLKFLEESNRRYDAIFIEKINFLMTLDLTFQTERISGRQYHIYRNCFRICYKTVILLHGLQKVLSIASTR